MSSFSLFEVLYVNGFQGTLLSYVNNERKGKGSESVMSYAGHVDDGIHPLDSLVEDAGAILIFVLTKVADLDKVKRPRMLGTRCLHFPPLGQRARGAPDADALGEETVHDVGADEARCASDKDVHAC